MTGTARGGYLLQLCGKRIMKVDYPVRERFWRFKLSKRSFKYDLWEKVKFIVIITSWIGAQLNEIFNRKDSYSRAMEIYNNIL